MAAKAFFIGKTSQGFTIPGIELKIMPFPAPSGLDVPGFIPDAALVSGEGADEALKLIETLRPDLPVFLLSDAPGPGAFLQAQLDGFDGVLPRSGITADMLRENAALAVKKRNKGPGRRLKEELEEKLAFEQAALNIVSEYAFCADMKEFSSITDGALSSVGTMLNVDRTYLFLFDNEAANNTNEWCAPGVIPQKDKLRNIPLKLFPRLIRRLKRGVPFAIGDLSEIPPESQSEKELLISYDIRSLVIFPVESGGELAGFFGMDNLPSQTSDPRQDYPILSIICQAAGKTLEFIRSREGLRQAMERYQSIVESDSALIVRFLPDCTILFCNEAYAKYIGGRPSDFIGRNLGEVRNKDVSYLIDAFAKLTPQSPRRLAENRAILPDGRWAWQFFNDIGIFDEAGKLKEVQSFGWDITDFKLAKQAGESEKRKALALFEHSPEAIAASWDGSSISAVNDAFCRLAGLQRGEIVGRTFAERFCFIPQDGPAGMAALAEKAALGEPAVAEGVFSAECGRELYLSVLALPVPDGSEEGRGLYLFFRDLTEIKEKERQLTANMEKLNRAFSQTVDVLAQAVESRDLYTAGHQRRTALLSEAIAARMELNEERKRGLFLAAAIHDVGKISVPAEILSKPGMLQPVEMDLIKTHSEEGYLILKKADFPWRLAEIVRQHHERMDGSGYPRGLRGEEILPEARILAVADVVEAMASHRPYRPSLGIGAALAFVEGAAGSLFDPAAVKACAEAFACGFSFGDS